MNSTEMDCTAYSNESNIESFDYDKYLNVRVCGLHHNAKSADFCNNSPNILVIFDSHALAQFNAIHSEMQDIFPFQTLTLRGELACSYLFDFDNDPRCTKCRKHISEIMKTTRIDYLFIISHMEHYINMFIQQRRTEKVSHDENVELYKLNKSVELSKLCAETCQI